MEEASMGNNLRPKVVWSLTDEGMGVLERAGLAGLYLTLTAAEEWAGRGDPQALELQQTLQWEFSDQSIKLGWEGKDLEVLTKLVKWAWQAREGVFWLPGVHPSQDDYEHYYKRLPTHTGLLQTFFQHNKVLPRETNPTTCIITIDENKSLRFDFKKLKVGKKFFQDNILQEILKKGISASNLHLKQSWIYPGAAKRFAKAEENWSGPTKLAFLLLFTPLSCLYWELPRTKGGTSNWAFVVPMIDNLKIFADYFSLFRLQTPKDFKELKILSLGDAALRFASAYAGRGIERRIGTNQIYVVAMGKVGHYANQNVRKRLVEVIPSDTAIKRYVSLMRELPNYFRCRPQESQTTNETDKGNAWIRQPTARGRIADNLIHNRPWYQELQWPHPWQLDELENQRQQTKKRDDKGISLEHLWFNNLLIERRALMNLAQEPSMWDSSEEQALLTIFHQTLRQLLNKEEEAQRRGGSRTLWDRWDDRVQDIRRGLMRAKTRELNRKFIMEFLAEGGGSRELTANKEALWRFLNHPYDWQKARDLAFLALVTFTDQRLGKPKETAETEEDISNE
jgi:CRISPR-associated protein Cas8a1/Csx13